MVSVKDVSMKGVSFSHKYRLDKYRVYKPHGHALRQSRWAGCVVNFATARKRFSDVDLFLTFTSSKSAIKEQDVIRLLDACASDGSDCAGLDMVCWESKTQKAESNKLGTNALPAVEECRLEKICTCLENSLLIIGVYHSESFGKALLDGILNKGRCQQRRLVGFGRAIGDASLVATLHDIMVDPEYRGYGIGRRVLLQLANQVGLSILYTYYTKFYILLD